MTPELRKACEGAMHVITADGTVIKGGASIVFIYETLGYGLVKLGYVPPLSYAIELGYRVVAANRMFFSRLFFTDE
jgi:hypothetical protein